MMSSPTQANSATPTTEPGKVLPDAISPPMTEAEKKALADKAKADANSPSNLKT